MAAEVILRVKVDRSQYNAFKKEVAKGIDTGGQNATANSLKEVGKQAESSTSKIQSLGEMLTKKIAWYSISMAISSVTTAFKNALTEIKEVDTQLTNIQKVSNASAEQMAALSEKAYSTASKYGVQASHYMEAVYEYTKAGFQDNADVMAELSTKAMLVGDTTAAIADKFLIAGNAAWKYGQNVEQLSLLVDKADYINNNYATTFDKLAEGFPRVASVASLAGMSAEETMAALGTITATTQETASRASTALRALIINILGDTTTEIEDGVTATEESIEGLRDALKKYAPDVIAAADATGKLIDPMKSLKALSEAYKKGDLTEAGLYEIESALGGKLRTNQLDALLKNFDMYEEMLQGMAGAAGTADKEIDIMLTSWEAKTKILNNTWTEFISKGLNADIFKKVIDDFTKLLDRFGGLNEILPSVVMSMAALFAPAIIGNIEKAVAKITNLKSAMSGGFRTVNAETGAIQTNWSAIGTAVSLGIGAIATAYTLYQNHVRKIRQDSAAQAAEAAQNAQTASNEFDNLTSLYSEYNKAKSAYEEGTGTKDAYRTATENLVVALGYEKTAVDALEGSLESLTRGQLEKKAKEIGEAVEVAERDIITEANTFRGYTENEIIQSAQRLQATGYKDYNGDDIMEAVDFDERLRRSVEAYKKYQDQLNALSAAYGAESLSDLNERIVSGDMDYITGLTASAMFKNMSKDDITKEINKIRGYLEEAEFVGNYVELLEAQEKYNKAVEEFGKDSEEAASAAEDVATAEEKTATSAANLAAQQKKVSDAFAEITGTAQSATAALEKYQKQLEGDTAESDAESLVEAAKKAVEAYEKGLKDSTAISAFADLWFSPGEIAKIREAGGNVADALMSNENFRRIFVKGTDENGETVFNEAIDAAKELAGILTEFDTDDNDLLTDTTGKQIWARLYETSEGMKIVVEDWEALAKQFGISSDTLKILLNLYGRLIPGLEASTTDMINFANACQAFYETAEGIKRIDLGRVIEKAFEEGATEDQVWNLVLGLQQMQENGDVELVVDDQQVRFAGGATQELIDKLDETTYTRIIRIDQSDVEDAKTKIDQMRAALDGIEDKNLTIKLNTIYGVPTLPDILEKGINQNASGTDYAHGGATLVNEEGAEIIQSNGRAWIAGGGYPTIANVPRGAKVWTAKETKAILGNSNLSLLYGGIKAMAGGSDVPSIISSVAHTTAWENARFGVDLSDDEALKNLQDMVSLRKTELSLIEQSGGSVAEQVEKQKGIQSAIVDVVQHLQDAQGRQEDITQLASEWYQINEDITKLQEEELSEAEKKHLEELEDQTALLKSQLDLLEARGSSTKEQIEKQREIRKSIIQQAEYLKQTGGSETEINKLLTERYEIDKSIKNLRAEERKEAREERKAAREEAKKEKERLEERRQKHLQTLKDNTAYLESQLALIEERDGSIKNQILKERQIDKSLQKQINYLRKIGGSNEEINQLKLKQLQIDKEIKAKEQELYNNLQAAIQRRMDDINTKRDEELAKVDEKIQKLKDEHDIQEETNELKEKELELEKAQDAYENAKRQRTVRVYNAATGQWEWTYDASKVSSAQESYESAKKALEDYKAEQEYEAEIKKLEDKQQKITDKYDKLLDQWQTVLDAMAEPLQTIKSALNAISNNATKDMRPTITKINEALSAMGKPTISKKNLYDSGGILSGIGGIKGTSADEIILPPDITNRMLKPSMTSQLSRRMEELRYIYGSTGNLAGINGMAIGSQHNGDIYTFGNITLSKDQAQSTTVYELANMARGLRSYSSAM